MTIVGNKIQGNPAERVYIVNINDILDNLLWAEAGNILTPKTNGNGVLIDVPTATRGALILQTTDDNVANNLFEAQNSGGTPLTVVNEKGWVGIGTSSSLRSAIDIVVGGDGAVILEGANSASFVFGDADAAGNKKFYQWRSDTDRASLNLLFDNFSDFTKKGIIFIDDNQRVIINNGEYLSGSSNAQLQINTDASTTIGQIIKGSSSQTANLTEWQDSSGAIVHRTGDGLAPSEWVHNEGGIDIDFRVEGVNRANALVVQGSNGFVGMGTTAPTTHLEVSASGAATKSTVVSTSLGGFFQFVAATDEAMTFKEGTSLFMGEKTNSSDNNFAVQSFQIAAGALVGINVPFTGPPNAQLEVRTNAITTIGQIIQASASQTANLTEWKNSSGTIQLAIAANARDFELDTTTGTKIGTATSQKLGLWNATPVIQQSSSGETIGFTAGSGAAAKDDSTFTGNVGATAYTISDIVKHLKTIGALAS